MQHPDFPEGRVLKPNVSILYEANEVCNVEPPLHKAAPPRVSILYEANEVCNGQDGLGPIQDLGVSILYEANEVCNFHLQLRLVGQGELRFNPLRG